MFIRSFITPLFLSQSLNGMLWDGDPGAGAPAAEPSAPAATPAPATPGASAAPASATPQATPASATPSTDDRSGWVPSYRLRETREAAIREQQTQWSQRESELQAEIKRIQSQLHSLVGVQQPQNPEVNAVRDQFGRLYPGLAQLEERAKDVMAMIEQAGDIRSQNEHYWTTYGRQSMDRLLSLAEKSYGAPLSEEGKRSLHSSFVGFVQSSPEMQQRYANDPTIVEDFWNSFNSSFVEPARRAASATVAGRVNTPIPQDRGGATPPPVTPGPKPRSLDERADAAWTLYQQNAKQ